MNWSVCDQLRGTGSGERENGWKGEKDGKEWRGFGGGNDGRPSPAKTRRTAGRMRVDERSVGRPSSLLSAPSDIQGLPLLWLMWRNERLLLTDWRWRIISTLARRGTRLALHGEGALCSTGRTFCWGSGLHGLVSVTGGTKEKERVRD